jgi:hypothetical protein
MFWGTYTLSKCRLNHNTNQHCIKLLEKYCSPTFRETQIKQLISLCILLD